MLDGCYNVFHDTFYCVLQPQMPVEKVVIKMLPFSCYFMVIVSNKWVNVFVFRRYNIFRVLKNDACRERSICG